MGRTAAAEWIARLGDTELELLDLIKDALGILADALVGSVAALRAPELLDLARDVREIIVADALAVVAAVLASVMPAIIMDSSSVRRSNSPRPSCCSW